MLLGNRRLMNREKIEVGLLEQEAEWLVKDSQTAMHLGVDGQLLGVVAVLDRIRASAVQAVQTLHALNVQTVLLTGDNAHSRGGRPPAGHRHGDRRGAPGRQGLGDSPQAPCTRPTASCCALNGRRC